MSAADIVEQMRGLSAETKREIVERIWVEYGDEMESADPDLTPEQAAELDRRAAEARAHPERCRPLEDVVADMQRRFREK